MVQLDPLPAGHFGFLRPHQSCWLALSRRDLDLESPARAPAIASAYFLRWIDRGLTVIVLSNYYFTPADMLSHGLARDALGLTGA